MKIFAMLSALALLSIGPLASAQSLRAPSLPIATATLANDTETNALALREDAAFQQFTQVPNDHAVSIPWGEWLGNVLAALGLAIGTAVSALVVRFLGKSADATAAQRLRDYTQSAVDYGINLVKGATHDQALSVPIANEVLERALEYSVDMFGGLVNQFGGTAAQRQRIISSLSVDGGGALVAPARTMTPLVERVDTAPTPAA